MVLERSRLEGPPSKYWTVAAAVIIGALFVALVIVTILLARAQSGDVRIKRNFDARVTAMSASGDSLCATPVGEKFTGEGDCGIPLETSGERFKSGDLVTITEMTLAHDGFVDTYYWARPKK